MPEPVTTFMIAQGALQLLSPYLAEAAKGGAGEMGKGMTSALGSAAAKLLGEIRARLAGSRERPALDRYEAAPNDAARRGALEYALEHALDADPDWRKTVEGLIDRLQTEVNSSVQTMHIEGSGNVTSQLSGAGNHVTIHGSTTLDA